MPSASVEQGQGYIKECTALLPQSALRKSGQCAVLMSQKQIWCFSSTPGICQPERVHSYIMQVGSLETLAGEASMLTLRHLCGASVSIESAWTNECCGKNAKHCNLDFESETVCRVAVAFCWVAHLSGQTI